MDGGRMVLAFTYGRSRDAQSGDNSHSEGSVVSESRSQVLLQFRIIMTL